MAVGKAAIAGAVGALGLPWMFRGSGDNYLAVRARPSRVAPELDRLTTGRQVWICDRDAVPGWTGIVYAAEPEQECNVGSPVPSPRAYGGPCRQGWVASRYLNVIAG